MQCVKSPLRLDGDKVARGDKGKSLVHIMYCNH